MHIDVNLVGNKVNRREGKGEEVRVATWNFSGLGSDHKQKKMGELLTLLARDAYVYACAFPRDAYICA